MNFKKGDYVLLTVQGKYSKHQVLATQIEIIGEVTMVLGSMYMVDCEDGIERRLYEHRLTLAE